MATDTSTIPETHSTTAPPSTDIAQGAPSTGAKPSSFRPPNPAFDAVVDRMYKRAGVTPPAKPAQAAKPPEPSKPAIEPKPDELPDDKPVSETHAADESNPPQKEGENEDGKDKPAESETPTPEPPGKEKKVSVYRLLDQWKKTSGEWQKKAETLAAEVASIKSGKSAELPKEVTERIHGLEAKVKDYEDRIQLLDYQTSDEFVTKHLKPYNDEYTRTMQRLQGIPVIQPDGSTKAIEPNDIFKLLVLPAGEAEVKAREMFGDFSGTVVRRVEKLQDLFDAQQSAIKDAKENGAARLKAQREQFESQQKEHQKFVNDTWEKENRMALTDQKYGKYFSPIEGDQKGNSALAQGLKSVSEAFSANPNDPKLTPDERAKIIRRHAKIYNAAAGFPRMVQWLEETQAENAALKAELKEYKKSEPTTTGSPRTTPPKASGDFYTSFAERLNKKARG